MKKVNREDVIGELLTTFPGVNFTDAELERRLGINLNHNVLGVLTKTITKYSGVSRSPLSKKWVFRRPSPPAPAAFRGQGGKCKGQLTITLSGPQGSGKSLVAKLLKALLPLTIVDAVVVEQEIA